MTDPVSIRRRLIWSVLIIIIGMSLIAGIGVYRGTTHETDEIFDAALVQTARILDGVMNRQAIEANRQQILQAFDSAAAGDQGDIVQHDLHEYEKKLFFIIRDTDGAVLVQSQFAPDTGLDIPDAGFGEYEADGKNWIGFTLKASNEDLWIIVGERRDVREEVTEYIARALLIPLVFVLPVALFFLWRTVSLALKPLNLAVEEVSRLDLGHLRKVEVEGVPQEIDPLIQAINDMVEKLDSAYQREKRFVSDASHELRNPLAALLINIDNAIEENADSEVNESLRSMKQSITRLSHLVSQLLLLSNSENPLTAQILTTVDMGRVCKNVVNSYTSIALKKNHALEFIEHEGDFRIQGVEPLLVSLISNLVDNAIKYCDDGAAVQLSCWVDKNVIVVQVDDSGKGLDTEMREKVVSRFFRAGQQSDMSAGLGLSIAKSIAEIHSATLSLSESCLGGLCVCVRFDLAQN